MSTLRIILCFMVTIMLTSVVQAQSPTTVKLHIFGASSVYWIAVKPIDDNYTTASIEWQDSSLSSFVAMAPGGDWGYYSAASSGQGFVLPLLLRLTSINGTQVTVELGNIFPDATVDVGVTFTDSAQPVPPSTFPSSSGDLCAVTSTSIEPIKLLVPLYVYPGAAWDQLITAAASVKIIAIINPNNGPVSTVDSSYSTYMTKLANAGIEMIGYVHTTYGSRPLAQVSADINLWAANYPLVTGIFLDEAAYETSQLSYYTQVYNYVISKPGYIHSILNPGVQPDIGYLSISSSIVIFENYATSLDSTSFSSWVTCAASATVKVGYKYRFTGIAHTTTAANQAAVIQALANKGMGLVYVTDGAGGCCTYNSLVSYFAQEAAAVKTLN